MVKLPRAPGAPFASVTPSDTQPVFSNFQREHVPITRRLAKVLPSANTCRRPKHAEVCQQLALAGKSYREMLSKDHH